jgi:autotransporter-associated beta strand protein
VRLLASASSLTIANNVDINANGSTGRVVLGADTNVVSGSVTFGGSITLQNIVPNTAENRTLTLVSSTGGLLDSDGVTLSGLISSANAEDVLSIEKRDSGRVTLSHANSYTGSTLVTDGILRIANGGALGGTAVGTTVSFNATLELIGGITVDGETLHIDGSGYNFGGALRNVSGNNTFNGPITLDNDSRIHSQAGLLTVGGITGPNKNLTFAGPGDTTVTGVIALDFGTLSKGDFGDVTGGTTSLEGLNTYTGATTINAGVLAVSNLADGGVASGIG